MIIYRVEFPVKKEQNEMEIVLKLERIFRISLPENLKILFFDFKLDKLSMWYAADEDRTKHKNYEFVLLSTGRNYSDFNISELRYIQSVRISEAFDAVFHIFLKN